MWVVLPLAAVALTTGASLAVKVRAACEQLGINRAGLTVPTALKACQEAVGIEQHGPLLTQADELMVQLGLSFEPAPPRPQRKQRDPHMPRLVVFDLDFTLWQPELFQLSSGPPFKACKDGSVVTARGERLDLFPAARAALAELSDAGVPIAIASRANEAAWAMEIMRLLRVDERRTLADVIGSGPVVIQGGSKVKHLKHISSQTGVPLDEILFFDNERSNIVEVAKMGCTCVYCPRGMRDGVYRDGLSVHLGNTRSGRRRSEGNGENMMDAAATGRRASRKSSKERKAGRRGRTRGAGGRNRR